jgi:hypothetical protein
MAITDGVGAVHTSVASRQSLGSDGNARTELNRQEFSVSVLDEQQTPPPPIANANRQNANIEDRKAGIDDQAAVERALKPLRASRVARATQHGTRGGATLGALIGGIVGTVLAPGVGTFTLAYLGALAGAAVGRAIGWGVGERQAGKIKLDSVAAKYGPGTKTFDRLARKARVNPGSLNEESKARISRTLANILSGWARQGHPLTPALVARTQTLLIKLEGWPHLSDQERRTVRERTLAALDARMLQRARGAVEDETPDFALWAADAFRQIATSRLHSDLEKVATAQLHDIIAGGWSLGEKALEATAVALVEIGTAWLDVDGKPAAMQALKAGIERRLQSGRPVDVAFVESTKQACIDAEQVLRPAAPHGDARHPDPVRDCYHAVVTGLIRNGAPPAAETREALLEALGRIQAQPMADERRRAAALTMFMEVLHERPFLKKAVDEDFVRHAETAVLETEKAIEEAQLGAGSVIDPDSVAAAERGCRQTSSAFLALGRSAWNRRTLFLEPFQAGMSWHWPEREEQLEPLETEANQQAGALTSELFPALGQESLHRLLDNLRLAFTASAHHTMARRALAGERRFDPMEIRSDFKRRIETRIRNKIRLHRRTARIAPEVYDALMGADGEARALLVAADMLCSSQALRRLDPDGVRACREIYGALEMAMTALGRQAGRRPEADIRRLHEVTARVFDPDGRFDPDAPPLTDDDWTAVKLDPQKLEEAKGHLLNKWPRAHAELLCLAVPHRNLDAAAQPPGDQAPGPQVLPLSDGQVAILARISHRG